MNKEFVDIFTNEQLEEKMKPFDNYEVEQCDIHVVVLQSEQLADQKRYCNDCGDYVGDGCDNKDCKDFKAN